MSKPEDLQLETIASSKKDREPLVLKHARISKRAEDLFKAMSTDSLLREQFVTDPAQVLHLYLEGSSLPPQQASVTNQLLYAVLSNPKLRDWLKNYAIEHSGQPTSSQEFVVDFARAVVEHGGDHVVLALIRSNIEKEGILGLSGPQAFLISSSTFIASGIIFRTNQKTSLAQDQRSSQNFDSSTEFDARGDAAQQSADRALERGRFFAPAYARVTIDALVQYAEELAQRGILEAAERKTEQ